MGTGVRAHVAPRIQLGRILAQIAAVDAAQGGETLVVLTADHGATWGATFAGKPTLGASTGNWYYGPTGLYDGTPAYFGAVP